MKAFSAHLFQPFSTAVIPVPGRTTERCDSLPQGNSARLISKTILHLSAEGPEGIKVAARSWGVIWTTLVQLHPGLWKKSLTSFPCLLHKSCFHPQAKASVRMPSWGCSVCQDLGQFTGLWLENLQAPECREPFSHSLSESYNHQIVTLKGGKSSGCVSKENSAWILREELYRRALQAVGAMQTDGLWVLPVSNSSPWKNGNTD